MRRAAPFLLLTLPTGAVAADLPRYDVSAHCARIAVVAGSARSGDMREACERREQEAHRRLGDLWPLLPPEAQRRCLWTAWKYGQTYDVLDNCTVLEHAAEERRRRRRS